MNTREEKKEELNRAEKLRFFYIKNMSGTWFHHGSFSPKASVANLVYAAYLLHYGKRTHARDKHNEKLRSPATQGFSDLRNGEQPKLSVLNATSPLRLLNPINLVLFAADAVKLTIQAPLNNYPESEVAAFISDTIDSVVMLGSLPFRILGGISNKLTDTTEKAVSERNNSEQSRTARKVEHTKVKRTKVEYITIPADENEDVTRTVYKIGEGAAALLEIDMYPTDDKKSKKSQFDWDNAPKYGRAAPMSVPVPVSKDDADETSDKSIDPDSVSSDSDETGPDTTSDSRATVEYPSSDDERPHSASPQEQQAAVPVVAAVSQPSSSNSLLRAAALAGSRLEDKPAPASNADQNVTGLDANKPATPELIKTLTSFRDKLRDVVIAGTNSTGLEKMLRTLGGTNTINEDTAASMLARLVKIAQERNDAKSTTFGSVGLYFRQAARATSVDVLYANLARVDVQEPNTRLLSHLVANLDVQPVPKLGMSR